MKDSNLINNVKTNLQNPQILQFDCIDIYNIPLVLKTKVLITYDFTLSKCYVLTQFVI